MSYWDTIELATLTHPEVPANCVTVIRIKRRARVGRRNVALTDRGYLPHIQRALAKHRTGVPLSRPTMVWSGCDWLEEKATVRTPVGW